MSRNMIQGIPDSSLPTFAMGTLIITAIYILIRGGLASLTFEGTFWFAVTFAIAALGLRGSASKVMGIFAIVSAMLIAVNVFLGVPVFGMSVMRL